MDGALANLYGLGVEDGRRSCPRCGFLTPEGSLYCPRCSFVLSEKEAVRVERLEERGEGFLEEVVRRILKEHQDLLRKIAREVLEERKGWVEDLREIEEWRREWEESSSHRVGGAARI